MSCFSEMKHMSFINDIWNSSKSLSEFWNCQIVVQDGEVKTNKLFLMSFGCNYIFPTGLCSEIPSQEPLVIHMRDFTSKEIRKACNGFIENCLLSSEKYGNQVQLEANCEFKSPGVIQPNEEAEDTELRGIGNQNFCHTCGKFFKTSKLFSVHLYQQHPSSPDKFQCPQCNKKFHHRFQLTKHKNVVHSNSIFQCQQCTLAYKSKKALKYHLKTVHQKCNN